MWGDDVCVMWWRNVNPLGVCANIVLIKSHVQGLKII